MEIIIRPLTTRGTGEVEVVERKGIGHPDTICDGLAEAFSRALSRCYLERFGRVLHHNVDKVLLWGGAARPAFGGGEIDAPIEVFLAGRAVRDLWGVRVPVDELAEQACREWIGSHLRHVDPSRHLRVHCLVRAGSADLAGVFESQDKQGERLANDTSMGAGYAPLSALERAVLEVERNLNAPHVKAEAPELGEDIKVMAVRRDERVHLTVACAFVGRFVRDLPHYLECKARCQERVLEVARPILSGDVSAEVNTADDPERGSVYLTVTGTSAESGDDGEAGRGNRANGLITPYRPMTLESVAGKNPITHVGKLYNVAARRMAEQIVSELAGIEVAHVCLVSQIGRPVRQPALVDLQLSTAGPEPLDALKGPLEALARQHLEGLDSLYEELIAGSIDLS